MAEYLTVEAFDAITRSLTAAEVRFLVVGGLAVQAHGLDRLTYDVDLVIQLEPANVLRAFEALAAASYRPMVPITARQFADAESRERFRTDKSMVVLNFWSDRFKETKLDVFVSEPFEFEVEYTQGLRDGSLTGVELRFPRAETLLKMKRVANRDKDANDILFLEKLLNRKAS